MTSTGIFRRRPTVRMARMKCLRRPLRRTSWRISRRSPSGRTFLGSGKRSGGSRVCATILRRLSNSSWNSTWRICSSRTSSGSSGVCSWRRRWRKLASRRKLSARWGACSRKRSPTTSAWSAPRWTKPCSSKSKVNGEFSSPLGGTWSHLRRIRIKSRDANFIGDGREWSRGVRYTNPFGYFEEEKWKTAEMLMFFPADVCAWRNVRCKKNVNVRMFLVFFYSDRCRSLWWSGPGAEDRHESPVRHEDTEKDGRPQAESGGCTGPAGFHWTEFEIWRFLHFFFAKFFIHFGSNSTANWFLHLFSCCRWLTSRPNEIFWPKPTMSG